MSPTQVPEEAPRGVRRYGITSSSKCAQRMSLSRQADSPLRCDILVAVVPGPEDGPWSLASPFRPPTSGRLASPANIVRIAQEAERLGYAAVWTYERLLRPMAELPSRTGGPPERIPKTYRLVYEPLETLSYVAAVTERVRLGTS